MKKSRFTETQIVAILKEADAGIKVACDPVPCGKIVTSLSRSLEQ